MRDVFGVKEPAIHLSAHIGTGRAWDDSLVASGFTFNGSIQGVFADFGSLVQFRNIGIELSIKDVVSAELAWGFVGIVDLKVPNSVVPLVLQYDLVPDSESCRLSMGLKEDEAWNDVFGVSGFNVSLEFDTLPFLT